MSALDVSMLDSFYSVGVDESNFRQYPDLIEWAQKRKKQFRMVVWLTTVPFLIALCVVFMKYYNTNNTLGFAAPATFMLIGWSTTLLFVGLKSSFGNNTRERMEATRRTKLKAFTSANHVSVTDEIPNPDYRGALFSLGDRRSSQQFTDIIKSDTYEIGTFTYEKSDGDNRWYIPNTYMRIEMNSAIPHLLLDAKSNDSWLLGRSNLDTPMASQKLQLEGDFNKYFTLYCPKGHEKAALYIFTPDLMALLIDKAHTFDAEIVDGQLFIYSTQHKVFAEPVVIQRLVALAEILQQKHFGRIERYRNEATLDGSPSHLTYNAVRPLTIRHAGLTSATIICWIIALVIICIAVVK